MANQSALDRVFEALSNAYRRQLLLALFASDRPGDLGVDPLAVFADTGDELATLRIALIHTHLPKLEEMGFIDWDREEGEIRVGPNWAEIAPLLELIDDNRSELPEQPIVAETD